MKPTMEKMTKPANMLVHELMQHTMMESLRHNRGERLCTGGLAGPQGPQGALCQAKASKLAYL